MKNEPAFSKAVLFGVDGTLLDWTVMPVGDLKAACPDSWIKKPGQLLEYLSTI